MNRDKQIEEIAKTCPYNVDGECMLDETHCTTYCEVSIWGVKTASEVAREIFVEIDKILKETSIMYWTQKSYCTHLLDAKISELRKKYESEGEG